MSSMPADDEPFVLEVPATPLAPPVVRAMAAAVAMVHDITLDDITDLRLAVDETCTMLLPLALPRTTLRCTVQVRAADLRVTARVRTTTELFPPDSLDRRILDSLATNLDTRVEPGDNGTATLTIELVLARTTT